MQIEEALEHYTTQLEADGRSQHTIGQVRRHVRLLAGWLDAKMELGSLTHESIACFLASERVVK